jgi:hypothetical protein
MAHRLSASHAKEVQSLLATALLSGIPPELRPYLYRTNHSTPNCLRFTVEIRYDKPNPGATLLSGGSKGDKFQLHPGHEVPLFLTMMNGNVRLNASGILTLLKKALAERVRSHYREFVLRQPLIEAGLNNAVDVRADDDLHVRVGLDLTVDAYERLLKALPDVLGVDTTVEQLARTRGPTVWDHIADVYNVSPLKPV